MRGNNHALPGEERALALWEAALEARYHGIELFGYEGAPDWFVYDGDFDFADPAEVRTSGVISGKYEGEKDTPLPSALRAGPVERARLAKSRVSPDFRWHYRHRAADLAWHAAALLPANDPRLPEMLDLAGRWLAGQDDAGADRFYQALERRCANTAIGKRATAARWFVDIGEYTIPNRPKEPQAPASE